MSVATSESTTPEVPPIRKLKAHAPQNSIGTDKLIFPFHSVPMKHRKMKPVGIEISSVDSM